MTSYKFTQVLPDEINKKPILISGPGSEKFQKSIYLIIEQNEALIPYEIRYEYTCSPFREVVINNHILSVGHEEYFYIFDTKNEINIISLKVQGYFGHLYSYNNLYYIADACGIICINKSGQVIWQNHDIAIDGVIINKFDSGKIYGQSEQDPPDHWVHFTLSLDTGKFL